ncbi:MAG TPA: tRNA (adenosine(37)-N6)-threonylcarbamoyltransferase complex ATPase subunit type 1 TsaE [Anaerolineae bacterium]|nr:tRNA (adenosine(37)-N6)-threonylcarbamoyltransferase complex ATPase subunit type 1 TsaE [Anaerolineae bacterium]
MELTRITHDESETEALGAALGRLLQPGDVLALVGDLGAGKTCLARGVARGLGIDEPVTSPTFILVAEYSSAAGFPLYHADCYRLEQAAAEAQAIGLDELLLDDGVAIVEWAERIEAMLPTDHLRITIEVIDDTWRELTFAPHGARAAELARRIVNGELLNC